jgi:hypothetical protein
MKTTINNLINRGLYMRNTTRKTNFINQITSLFVNQIIGLYMRSTTRKTQGQEISYLLILNIFNISLMGGRS